MSRVFTKPFSITLTALALFVILAPNHASAATNIYYSVGQNTSDHKTGSPTVTISGTTATFSVAQTATNMGIGDIINYGGARAFITGKTSTSVWSVSTATGTTPVATTTAPVTSIVHAFDSLKSAIHFGDANTAISTSFLNTSNLVSGNYVLNIPLYNDSGAPESWGFFTLVIDGHTTDATHYINLYTPTSTASQVNQSQRHSGVYNQAVGYTIQANTNSPVITLNTPYVRIDGLQIKNTKSDGAGFSMALQPASVSNEYFISNNIFQGFANATQHLLIQLNGGPSRQVHIWNNLFVAGLYGITGGLQSTLGTSTVYNNTFYDNITAIDSSSCVGGSNVVYTNNLFASTTNPFTAGSCGAPGSGYNLTTLASLGYTVPVGSLGNDLVNQTITFFDAPAANYALASNDASARNNGTTSPAGDSYFPFTSDIVSASRPQQSGWDIGAFEYVPVPDVLPPGLSAPTPSGRLATTTTSTTIGINTNEAATCKYSTTPGVAYTSMANTFSTTGGTTHSGTVSGLSSGRIYNYYVRCQDASSNVNSSDTVISFFVNQANQTIFANSCAQSDVSPAYAFAYNGDTILLPAGTCTDWSATSNLTLAKQVTLKGAGIDQTILNIASSGSAGYGSGIFYLSAPSSVVRDMTINAANSGISGNMFVAQAASGWRITNIKFVNHVANTDGYFVYPDSTASTNGYYGLIDHVDVTGAVGNDELIFVRGPSNSWQTASSMGTSRALFIENSVFRGSGYVTDCNANSRCVVRGNVITGDMKIDVHGAETNSPARSARHSEVYNNTWAPTGILSTGIEMRGGTGMIFNNRVNTAGVPWFFLHDYTYHDGNSYAAYGGHPSCPSNYPVLDQIGIGQDPKVAASEPFYLWDNSLNNGFWPLTWKVIEPTALSYCNTTYGDTNYDLQTMIRYNRDYYISSTSASFTGATAGSNPGVGSGLFAAKPATCTVGVAYWATDRGGNWNTEDNTSVDGALYKCISTNTWATAYTPYAYPHYLTAASTTGTTLIDRGAGARMFPNGKFYPVSTSTASGTYADMSVTFGTTSPDYWLDVAISTWSTSGTRRKVWTEASETLGATSTIHVIGDLTPAETYTVKVDTVLGANITGGACTSGVCTADGGGKITFTYSGGYSSHTFDVESTSAASAPSITTSSASSLTQTTATLNGDITATNGSNATTRGFAYGTSATLATTIATTTESGSFGTGTYTGSASGLSCNTTYYVRAYATNSADTSYGSIVSFVTSVCVTQESVSVQTSSSGGSSARRVANLAARTGVLVTNQTPTLSTFIEALIKAGVVPADKVEAARSLVTVTTPSGVSSASFKRDLQLHDTGADVKTLQTLLISKGFLPKDKATGTFGTQTLSALKKYQASIGVSATGYFGPRTRAGVR